MDVPCTGAKNPINWRRELLTLFTMVTACVVQAFVLTSIYTPKGLVGGGITGLAMLFDYAFGVPTWVMILALNVPLMLIGMRMLNVRLIIYASLATVTLTLALGLIPPIELPVENPLVLVLFGSVILGGASAPIIRLGGSMGGVDVLAIILNKKFSFAMGSIKIALNIGVIALLGFINDLESVLMSIIALFMANISFNNLLQGLNRTKTVFIISDHWDEIAPHVLNELHRGVTYIPAKGAYSGKDKTLVYCIVRTVELASVKRIVREHDPCALFSIIDTREVVGRGFSAMN